MTKHSIILICTVVLLGCSKRSPSASDPGYRVIVSPTSDQLSVMPLSTNDWTVSFQFTVPPLPSTSTWNAASQVFYVWGDISFEEYGTIGRYPINNYRINQIVPQVMVGHAVDQADANYEIGSSDYSNWVIQSQYIWQSADQTTYGQVGEIFEVSPGDLLTESIAYTASDGKIVATISASASKTSTITIARPFPNESTPPYSSWRDFFQQAEAQSGNVNAMAVMNIETHAVDANTMCSVLPFTIQSFTGPNFPSLGSGFTVSTEGGFSCAEEKADLQF